MDGYGPAQFSLPRPGRALKSLLIVIAALGIFEALVSNWASGGWLFMALDYDFGHIASGQVWRLLTSGLLTDPKSATHLIFTLMGLYFLGADLERRWGGGRLLRFLAYAVVAGNILTFLCTRFLGAVIPARFVPEELFGASAALTAIAIAWSMENATATIRLFFFLPITGRMLLWITLGFCLLDLVYPTALAEGALAPIGGALVGVTLAGRPSLLRRAYLHVKLALLRRQGYGLRVEDIIGPDPSPKRPRGGKSPPLRVVQGGLEEVLRKRNPPKDKRHLN